MNGAAGWDIPLHLFDRKISSGILEQLRQALIRNM
jgi:hypothetical protein